MTDAEQATPADSVQPLPGSPPPGQPVGVAGADNGGLGEIAGGGGETITKPQLPWGALVVIAGLVAIVIVSLTAILHYKHASDVATATVGVSGVIAALVGAYFGIRGSSLAQTSTESKG